MSPRRRRLELNVNDDAECAAFGGAVVRLQQQLAAGGAQRLLVMPPSLLAEARQQSRIPRSLSALLAGIDRFADTARLIAHNQANYHAAGWRDMSDVLRVLRLSSLEPPAVYSRLIETARALHPLKRTLGSVEALVADVDANDAVLTAGREVARAKVDVLQRAAETMFAHLPVGPLMNMGTRSYSIRPVERDGEEIHALFVEQRGVGSYLFLADESVGSTDRPALSAGDVHWCDFLKADLPGLADAIDHCSLPGGFRALVAEQGL